MKRILICTIAFFAIGISPVIAQEQSRQTIEGEISATSVTVQGAIIHIKNASNMTVDIYNITGVKVYSHRIESSEQSFELNNLQICKKNLHQIIHLLISANKERRGYPRRSSFIIFSKRMLWEVHHH